MGVIVAEIKTKTSKEIGIPKPHTPQYVDLICSLTMSCFPIIGIKERFALLVWFVIVMLYIWQNVPLIASLCMR